MENELEKLIVRLVGDPTLYIKALSQAAQETTKASGQIESSLRRIEQSMAQNMGRASQNVVNSLKQGTDSVQAFTGQVKAFGQALTGALAFAGIGNGLRDILGLFDKYETTMILPSNSTRGSLTTFPRSPLREILPRWVCCAWPQLMAKQGMPPNS